MNLDKIQKIILLIVALALAISGVKFADQNTTWSLLSFILAMISIGIIELINIKIVLEDLEIY